MLKSVGFLAEKPFKKAHNGHHMFNLEKIQSNYEMLVGSYFQSTINFGDNLLGFRSDIFPDSGWNYLTSNSPKIEITSSISSRIAEIYGELLPSIMLFEGQTATNQGDPLPVQEGFGVWMTCTADSLPNAASRDLFDEVQIFAPLKCTDINSAVRCFTDAYCNDLPDGIGYSGLDGTYPRGFKYQLENGDNCHLVAAYKNGQMVALATIVLHRSQPTAGLYNVAVPPPLRGRGYGKAISYLATEFAFSQGAKECLLQTESHTPVQDMYASLGYSVDFHLNFAEYPNG